MLIETDKPLPDNARLSCSFLLPDSTSLIHASGKIVRTVDQNRGENTYQYGLMFTDILPETKQQLTEYVEKTRTSDIL
jgi:c-di-GMP-binding flagellar brake protein YcgR